VGRDQPHHRARRRLGVSLGELLVDRTGQRFGVAGVPGAGDRGWTDVAHPWLRAIRDDCSTPDRGGAGP